MSRPEDNVPDRQEADDLAAELAGKDPPTPARSSAALLAKAGPHRGPFRYDPHGAIIWAEGNAGGPVPALDVRGYGHLVGTLRLSTEAANAAQDVFGEAVAAALNAARLTPLPDREAKAGSGSDNNTGGD